MTIAAGLRRLEVQRAGIGLLQGGLLLLLVRAANAGTWPESLNLLHAPLLLAALFVPIVALCALDKLSPRPLVLWLGAVTLVILALGAYDVYRRTGAPQDWDDFSWFFQLERKGDLLPPATSRAAFLALGLFIAHSLVQAGAADRLWIARYATYFDVSWVLGIQVALAIFFTGLFWGALELGSGLFHMIGVDFFEHLFERDWFILPATAAAFSLGLHLSDARADWVRGIRRLVLILLSWLLPLLALFAIGFLAALPVMGVEALWRTRYGASLVLTTACCLIALLNATYQQGETPPPFVLRWIGRAAALALLPLVALGFWATWLRVTQYGLTPQRVVALTGIAVLACYAIGYLIAALWKGPWLKVIERCNIFAAFMALAVILAVTTPLADPARLTVANQIARLESGTTPAAKLDFKSLRFDGERYGKAALLLLRQTQNGADADFIRRQAALTLTLDNRYSTMPMRPQDLAANITVYPAGKALDASFLETKWDWQQGEAYWNRPDCLVNATKQCDAYLVNLDGQGTDEVVIPEYNTAWVFHQDSAGRWDVVGELVVTMPCKEAVTALKQGTFTLVPPPPSPWQDIDVAGGRMTVRPVVAAHQGAPCWE
jgi:hypothetical protein